jgi:hypothetical protein
MHTLMGSSHPDSLPITQSVKLDLIRLDWPLVPLCDDEFNLSRTKEIVQIWVSNDSSCNEAGPH